MITVIVDFNKRVKEIDDYYKLLENVLNKDAKLYYPGNKTHRVKNFDEELIKVLKANCFLLLYNLIESSIKSSITEIYDSISSSNKKYEEVIDNIRKIWILEKYKNFKKDEHNVEFIFDTIQNITDDIIDIQFSDKSISGNIDGRKIRRYSATYGFSDRTHYSARNGEKLHQVKVQRNKLAHGSISFSECGRQYTFEDLQVIKKQVVIYLRGILNNIKRYIENNDFEQ